MRIEQTRSNQAQGAQAAETSKTRKTAKELAAEKGQKADRPSDAAIAGSVKTEISSRAHDLAHAKSVATNAPDTREAKIAELKARIAEGRYKVDNEAIADRMVDDHLKMSGMS
jgi:negative regulator of flagellin synthesis FlgM